MRPPKLVVGHGVGTAADVHQLAARIANHARTRGLALIRLSRSRDPNSASCYLELRDAAGRQWLIRVSNHHRPRSTRHPVPHFDLTALDGTSGFDEACAYVDRIAAREIAWAPAEAEAKRRRHRR